jgi:hypothetical protein
MSAFLGKWFEAQARVNAMIERAQWASPEERKKYNELRKRMLEALLEYGDFINREMGEPLQRDTIDLAAEIAIAAFETLLAGATLARIFDREEWRGVMEAMEQNFQPRLIDRVYKRLNTLNKNPYAKKRS